MDILKTLDRMTATLGEIRQEVWSQENEKLCRVCGVKKPKTKEHWYAHPDTRDGLNSKCKECH